MSEKENNLKQDFLSNLRSQKPTTKAIFVKRYF